MGNTFHFKAFRTAGQRKADVNDTNRIYTVFLRKDAISRSLVPMTFRQIASCQNDQRVRTLCLQNRIGTALQLSNA